MNSILYPLFLLAGLAQASPHPAHQVPLGDTTSSVSYTASNPLEDVINASPFLSFHRDLVQISSISGNEHNVGSFVAEFLESHNFTVIKQPVVSNEYNTTEPRFNVFAYPSSSSSPHPEILLTSHIDTVPPFIPYSLDRPDATTSADSDSGHDSDGDARLRSSIRISGRGSVDAKASVAAQVFAALDILAESPTAPIGLLFVIGEEVGGDGMRAFSNSSLNPSPSAFHTVIFGEPTELALVSGHKGMLGFDLLSTGQAAHSGYPWLGSSAISSILPALARIDRLGDIPGGLPPSDKYGHTTLNIGKLDGGVAMNVVPASARATVAVRLAAGTPDEARTIIARAVRDATGGDENVVVDFAAHRESYPPQDLDADVSGFEVTTVNYGTDVPNLEIHGRADGPVRRYLYGPGSIFVAHGDHEALTVGDLEQAVGGYRRLVEAAFERVSRS